MKKIKGLVLFSGGLDSLLTAKLLLKQKIEIKLITFKSYFFNGDLALKSAKQLSLKPEIIDISEDHLRIVKKPKFGYGAVINPCIDCHLLMLKKAKEKMEKEGFNFIATGEVLGERPMSQNIKALKLIEKESSLSNFLIRPLSAKLLPPTLLEKKGLIKRELLEAIKGRSRKRQLILAKEFKFSFIPSPAGGCLLTDLNFGKRLKELKDVFPDFKGDDIELLKLGRHFWEDKVKIVVGRNKEENFLIEKLTKKGDILVKIKNYPSPTTLIRSYNKKIEKEVIDKAKFLTVYYSNKAKNKKDIEFLLLKK